MQEAQRSAVYPGGALPITLFISEATHSEVLQRGHSSQLVCHPRLTVVITVVDRFSRSAHFVLLL